MCLVLYLIPRYVVLGGRRSNQMHCRLLVVNLISTEPILCCRITVRVNCRCVIEFRGENDNVFFSLNGLARYQLCLSFGFISIIFNRDVSIFDL